MLNPFPDEQLDLLDTVPKQVSYFSSISIFCLGCKRNSRRAARRPIVLHPKRNISSELKWQTCSGTMPSKFSCLSVKGSIWNILAQRYTTQKIVYLHSSQPGKLIPVLECLWAANSNKQGHSYFVGGAEITLGEAKALINFSHSDEDDHG